MKNKIYILLFAILPAINYACPMCEKQQPKIFRGIAHGAGPESNFDYVIISIMAALVLITLFYSLKYLIKPSENNKNHIKRNRIIFE